MTRDQLIPVCETWIHAPGIAAASLRAPIADLGLTDLLAEACAAAGARTVADVLALQKTDMLAMKGLGRRCWQQLKRAVCRHLHDHRRPRPVGRGTALDGLSLPPRAKLALTRLGLTTREAWLSASPDALLAIPDLDAAELAVAQTTLAAAPPSTLWPAQVLRTSLLRLELPARLRRALAAGGYRTLGDLRCADPLHVAAVPGVGTAGVRTLRGAMARSILVRPTSRPATRAAVPTPLEKILRRLAAADRGLVEASIGLDGRRTTEAQLAGELGVRLDKVAPHREQARDALLARGGRALERLCADAAAELEAQGGVLQPSRLASNSPLRALTGPDSDPVVALRLLAFLTPESLSLVDDVLMDLPAAIYPRVARQLARAVETLRLPMPLARVCEHLAAAGLSPLPRGLLEVLIRQVPRVQIVVDPRHGDTLRRRSVTVAARIEAMLRNAPGSLQASDILFAYRDRFGSARKLRLVDALHAEKVFLQVGPDEWDLRERHLDELEMAQPEADRIRELIVATDCACGLVNLVAPGSSIRLVYLIRDILHHDLALRSLGRGVFCGRQLRSSTHVQLLRHELRRAMGEVPVQRFLANQPDASRRIRARLLAENRLFISTAPDRVDLATNYPLNEERLGRILHAIETLIAESGGYDRIDRLAAEMRGDEVGGSFVTPHFLADLLRRHGHFESLPGGIVTTAASGMRGRLMHRVRTVIRAADRPLSVNEILAASPDLAEFAGSLTDLLREDPLVQSRDEHYAVP